MTVSIPGVPAQVANLIQDRTLERMFHDALFPRLLYRSEAMPEMWQVNLGERMVFTRAGLIPVSTTPLVPGADPSPNTFAYEQWEAEANQFGDTIDTHMPTSYVALAPLFLRNTQQLGLNAGQTLNTLVRNRLYRAYLSGNTVTTNAATSTTVPVASLNGFTDTLVDGRPTAVSGANPLPATIGTTAVSVVNATPSSASDPFGPGSLTLAASATWVARDAVIADQAASIVRAGGGNTTDIPGGSGDLTLGLIRSAVARLRSNNVPTCSDGYYHVHLTPEGESQIFSDNEFQRLYQSLPESAAYRDQSIGQLLNCRFYRNTENPNRFNSGALVSTGTAETSGTVGGEIINGNGDEVRRAIVLGGGAIYEKYLDESRYMTEAGATGKIGQFTVTNNGVMVMTNRIRYILRSPLDRLQQVVSQSWSWSGDFPVPSDSLEGDSARFKRAIAIEHL